MMFRREVVVNDLMQKNYVYFLTEKPGEHFHAGFQPELTPKEMLALGVFGGKYMTDCTGEFPSDWFDHAKLCHERHDPELNFFSCRGFASAGGLARQRVDTCGGSARLVPMVLPLLHGKAFRR